MASLRRATSSLRRQPANPAVAAGSSSRINAVRIAARTATSCSHFRRLTSAAPASGQSTIPLAAWRRTAASALSSPAANSAQLAGLGLLLPAGCAAFPAASPAAFPLTSAIVRSSFPLADTSLVLFLSAGPGRKLHGDLFNCQHQAGATLADQLGRHSVDHGRIFRFGNGAAAALLDLRKRI